MFAIATIRSIFLSIYSGDFYKDLYFKDKKIRFLALLFVIAAANFATILPFYSFTKSIISSNYDSIINLQKIEFKDQKLSVHNKDRPLILHYNNQPFAIVDTLNPAEKHFAEKFYIIVSKTGIFALDTHNNHYQKFDFVEYNNENSVWDQNTIKVVTEYLNNSSKFLIFAIAYPIGILITSIFLSLKLLFFSFVGFVYGKVSKVSFSIYGLLRIAVFAIIPSLLMQLGLILYLLLSDISVLEFYSILNRSLVTNLSLVIFIGYFFAALDTVRNAKKHLHN